MTDKTVAPVKSAEPRPSRREPLDLLADMQDEMSRFWTGWPFMRPLRRLTGGSALTGWTPRIDMFEQNGNIVVKAELPGVKKDDIEVTIDGGDLVIRGERQEEHEVKEEHYYRMERSSGAVYRRIALPENVDEDKIDASLSDGLLVVTVPKVAEKTEAARKVTIK